MDVQDLARKLAHEPGREQAHVSGKADQINFMLLQRGDYFAVVLFAGLSFGRNNESFESQPQRGFKPSRIGAIGNYDPDAGVLNLSRGDVLCDDLEVRPASREQ